MLAVTFSRRKKAFAARIEMAAEVAKALLKEIIPRFGLAGFLQSDNDSAFVSPVTKGLMSVLDINWTLYLSWKP